MPQDIQELAQRYGVSSEAVTTLSQAITDGHGTMAQFNIPELGGLGQWSQGGMTMVGDMFNTALKAKVEGLCSDLARLLSQEKQDNGVKRETATQQADWWGADLQQPSATGSQNNIRYAYFSDARRLAIKIDDAVTIYDTAEHEIGGVSQQQSRDSSLTFTSQHGLVRVADLRVVSPEGR